MWLDSSKEDIEAHGTGIESGFLRNEGYVLAVFLNVEFADVLAVNRHSTSNGIVEAFYELNNGTLAAPRGTDEGNVCSGLDGEIEVPQYAHGGASGVAEVEILAFDEALYLRNNLSFVRFGIDFWNRVKKSNNFRSGDL
jgi:hypothetical protein